MADGSDVSAAEESPSDEAVNDEVESPSTDTDEEAEGEDGESESPSDETVDPDDDEESQEYKNAVKRYGSDSKIAREMWRAQKRASELAKENKALKARPSGPPAEQKPQEPPPLPQELQKIDTEIQALNKSIEDLKPRIDEVTSDHDKAVGIAQRLMALRDNTDKDVDPDRYANLDEQFKAKMVEIKSHKRQYDSLKDREGDLRDRIGIRERLRDTERARLSAVAEEEAEFQQEFPKTVEGYIASGIKQAGVTLTKSQADELKDAIFDFLSVLSWKAAARGMSAKEIDFKAVTHKRVSQWAERHGYAERRKLRDESESRREVQKPVAPRAPGAPRPITAETKKPPSETQGARDLARAKAVMARRGW